MTVDEKCIIGFPCLPEFQNTHTEHEESWDDSSSHSLLAACQLEAIAGKGSHRQTPLLTAEAVTAQCSQGAIFEKEVRDGFIPSYISCHSPLRNSRFHPVMESEGKHPVLVEFHYIISQLSLRRRQRGNYINCRLPAVLRITAPRLLSFTSLAASSMGTERHTANHQTQTRVVFSVSLSI